MSDVFSVDVHHDTREAFDIALSLFGTDKKVGGYSLEGGRFTLYWGDHEKKATKLPYEMTIAQVTPLVYDWLAHVQYPPRPDTDGSTKKGWRVFNRDLGSFYGVFAVVPEWTVYGK